MFKEYFTDSKKRSKQLGPIIGLLLVAAVGSYLLGGSHAATPYASITASQGTVTNGATLQSCSGATDGGCVTFGRPVAMDGNVALGLSGPGTPFAATSFWNTPLPDNIPANPNAAAYDNDIAYDLCHNLTIVDGTPPTGSNCPDPTFNGALNTSLWSAPLYVVPANQPLVPVYRYNYVTDQNMGDSNWVSTGWTTTTTSATHTTGNTDPLTGYRPVPQTAYQVSYTFSGSPAIGSTVLVTMGGVTVGNYTFSSSQDNFTDTKSVTTATANSTALSFKPSSTFNGTISVVAVRDAPNANFTAAVAGGVPIPADAHGAGDNGDALVQIYQPSKDKYWDFWHFYKDSTNNWEASWGGQISSVSQSDGIFANDTGASATSLPLIGGIPRIEELQAGQIDHVVDLMLAENLNQATIPANVPVCTTPSTTTDCATNNQYTNGVSWPATRTDGFSTDPLAVPEGQRFRLPPDCTIPPAAAISPCVTAATMNSLSPVAKTIAVAVQKYGFVVVDTAEGAAIRMGDPTTYTVAGLPNPYTTGPGVGGVNNGNKGLFGGSSSVMANFPWSQLEALPFNYGKPSA
jgi:hypothetical protein